MSVETVHARPSLEVECLREHGGQIVIAVEVPPELAIHHVVFFDHCSLLLGGDRHCMNRSGAGNTTWRSNNTAVHRRVGVRPLKPSCVAAAVDDKDKSSEFKE